MHCPLMSWWELVLSFLIDVADGEPHQQVHDDDAHKEQEEEEDQLSAARVPELL